PQIAQTMYQYNLQQANRQFQERQLTLREKEIDIQEKVFEEQIKMSQFQREDIGALRVDLIGLEKSMQSELIKLQKKQTATYDSEIAARLDDIRKGIELKTQQIESLIASAQTDTDRLFLAKEQAKIELIRSNISTIGMAHSMLKPEGFKMLETNWNKARDASPTGIADLTQVLADTIMQNEGANIFTQGELAFMQAEISALTNIYTNYTNGVLDERKQFSDAAHFNFPDKKAGKEARKTLTGESNPTASQIEEGLNHYSNARLGAFTWESAIGQFNNNLRFKMQNPQLVPTLTDDDKDKDKKKDA
ncbi:hypothetical protein LCGC14_2753220, partial [marine sediment metagenome]